MPKKMNEKVVRSDPLGAYHTGHAKPTCTKLYGYLQSFFIMVIKEALDTLNISKIQK